MKILKTIAINFMVFSVIIIGLEIAGQFAYLATHGTLLFWENASLHRKLFEIHPYLAGRLRRSVKVTKDHKTITTTNFHTRWTGAAKLDNNLVRIAVLGGSSTFCTGVTDADSWPAILQTKLGKRYAVINYGVPGYSTAENIIQMALIVPEKRPHFVIFYEGLNDIKNYHKKNFGPDYYWHGMGQFGNLGIPVYEPPYRLKCIANIFVTAWLLDRLKSEMTNSNKNTNMALLESADRPDQCVDKIYVRNLNTLKLLSEKIDAFPIFIPQVLNVADYFGKQGAHRWTAHIRDDAMPSLMKKFNVHMHEVCSPEEKNCIVLDEVLKEKWNSDDFVDECHFSKSGGLKFAGIVAQAIFNLTITENSKAE